MTDTPQWAVAIHGGAGRRRREPGPDREAEIRASLVDALEIAARLLAGGKSALDAVEAAVVALEDSPHFNAGRGSVFTADGTIECDASIMDGRDLRAGAVAGVARVKNPIRAARVVMERTPHVFLYGAGAEALAAGAGLEIVDPSYFRTEARWQELLRARARQGEFVGGGDRELGTVGAVARDRDGNVAAATSTGGTTGKLVGRIGDSPVIGAGTYADNASCAVSATGAGEHFIRAAVARTICAEVELRGASLDAAARAAIARVARLGGTGGVIAVNGRGEIAFAMNTEIMRRGSLVAGGRVEVEAGGG